MRTIAVTAVIGAVVGMMMLAPACSSDDKSSTAASTTTTSGTSAGGSGGATTSTTGSGGGGSSGCVEVTALTGFKAGDGQLSKMWSEMMDVIDFFVGEVQQRCLVFVDEFARERDFTTMVGIVVHLTDSKIHVMVVLTDTPDDRCIAIPNTHKSYDALCHAGLESADFFVVAVVHVYGVGIIGDFINRICNGRDGIE